MSWGDGSGDGGSNRWAFNQFSSGDGDLWPEASSSGSRGQDNWLNDGEHMNPIPVDNLPTSWPTGQSEGSAGSQGMSGLERWERMSALEKAYYARRGESSTMDPQRNTSQSGDLGQQQTHHRSVSPFSSGDPSYQNHQRRSNSPFGANLSRDPFRDRERSESPVYLGFVPTTGQDEQDFVLPSGHREFIHKENSLSSTKEVSPP